MFYWFVWGFLKKLFVDLFVLKKKKRILAIAVLLALSDLYWSYTQFLFITPRILEWLFAPLLLKALLIDPWELIVMHCHIWPVQNIWVMAAQKQDDQLERTFSSYVRIQDVVLKTYLGRWTIGRSGERGSGISVLPARYDDDDEMNEWIGSDWKDSDLFGIIKNAYNHIFTKENFQENDYI